MTKDEEKQQEEPQFDSITLEALDANIDAMPAATIRKEFVEQQYAIARWLLATFVSLNAGALALIIGLEGDRSLFVPAIVCFAIALILAILSAIFSQWTAAQNSRQMLALMMQQAKTEAMRRFERMSVFFGKEARSLDAKVSVARAENLSLIEQGAAEQLRTAKDREVAALETAQSENLQKSADCNAEQQSLLAEIRTLVDESEKAGSNAELWSQSTFIATWLTISLFALGCFLAAEPVIEILKTLPVD